MASTRSDTPAKNNLEPLILAITNALGVFWADLQEIPFSELGYRVCCLRFRSRSRAWTLTCATGTARRLSTSLRAVATRRRCAGCCVTALASCWTSSGRARSTTQPRTSRWRCARCTITRCARSAVRPETHTFFLFQCLNILVQHGATPDYPEARHKPTGCSCCKGESQGKVSPASLDEKSLAILKIY